MTWSMSLSQHQVADTTQNRMKEILRLAAPPGKGPEDKSDRISISNRSSGDASDNVMVLPSIDTMDFDDIGLFGVGEEEIDISQETEFSQTLDSLASSQILPSNLSSQMQASEIEVEKILSAEDSAKDQFTPLFANLSPAQVLLNIQQDLSPQDLRR